MGARGGRGVRGGDAAHPEVSFPPIPLADRRGLASTNHMHPLYEAIVRPRACLKRSHRTWERNFAKLANPLAVLRRVSQIGHPREI